MTYSQLHDEILHGSIDDVAFDWLDMTPGGAQWDMNRVFDRLNEATALADDWDWYDAHVDWLNSDKPLVNKSLRWPRWSFLLGLSQA